jgi:hypothetical protein
MGPWEGKTNPKEVWRVNKATTTSWYTKTAIRQSVTSDYLNQIHAKQRMLRPTRTNTKISDCKNIKDINCVADFEAHVQEFYSTHWQSDTFTVCFKFLIMFEMWPEKKQYCTSLRNWLNKLKINGIMSIMLKPTQKK